MKSKKRILLVTDSHVLPTGLAETTRLIFENLLKAYPSHYDVHQIGLGHVYAIQNPSWPIYPTRAAQGPSGEYVLDRADINGELTFQTLLPELKPDIVFAFNDPQRVQYLCSASRKYKLILYVNFDGGPLSPGSYGPFLRESDRVFTLSQFSRSVLAAANPTEDTSRIGYMYSPADTARFAPVSESDKNALREDLLPNWMARDAFILGWIGRNQWRKQIWALFSTLSYLRKGKYLECSSCDRITLLPWDPISRNYADQPGFSLGTTTGNAKNCIHCGSASLRIANPMPNVYLWLHMARNDPSVGWPLRGLEYIYDVKPNRDLHYTDKLKYMAQLSPTDVPKLYQVWDCLLYLSGGEGFGNPAWEALSSGLPVVYTDYSSHAELANRAGGGLPVGGIFQPEPKTCIWRIVARIEEAVSAVRKLIQNPGLREKLGIKGRAFAEKFNIANQVEEWHHIFQSL